MKGVKSAPDPACRPRANLPAAANEEAGDGRQGRQDRQGRQGSVACQRRGDMHRMKAMRSKASVGGMDIDFSDALYDADLGDPDVPMLEGDPTEKVRCRLRGKAALQGLARSALFWARERGARGARPEFGLRGRLCQTTALSRTLAISSTTRCGKRSNGVTCYHLLLCACPATHSRQAGVRRVWPLPSEACASVIT